MECAAKVMIRFFWHVQSWIEAPSLQRCYCSSYISNTLSRKRFRTHNLGSCPSLVLWNVQAFWWSLPCCHAWFTVWWLRVLNHFPLLTSPWPRCPVPHSCTRRWPFFFFPSTRRKLSGDCEPNFWGEAGWAMPRANCGLLAWKVLFSGL